MKHFATQRFWSCYYRLPEPIRHQADASYALLKADPQHPSLRLKRVGALYSVRISLKYRALAAVSEQDLVWFWIGTHAEYDQLIG